MCMTATQIFGARSRRTIHDVMAHSCAVMTSCMIENGGGVVLDFSGWSRFEYTRFLFPMNKQRQ